MQSACALLLVFARYELVEPADNMFGIRLENGTWSGMMGQVIAKVRGRGICTGGALVRNVRRSPPENSSAIRVSWV